MDKTQVGNHFEEEISISEVIPKKSKEKMLKC